MLFFLEAKVKNINHIILAHTVFIPGTRKPDWNLSPKEEIELGGPVTIAKRNYQ